MADSIYINGSSLEALGLRLVDGGPSLDGLQRSRATVPLPGRAGHLSSPFSTTEPRVYRFACFTTGITTVAQRLALLDYYSDLLTGPVELRFVDGTTRCAMGICRVFQGAVQSPTFVNIAATITVEVVCANAARYESEPSMLVLGTTPVPVPVGTVAHGGYIITTTSGFTPFTVTYRSVGGVALGQIAVSPTLASGDYLILDLDAHDVVKVDTAGVRTREKLWDTSPTTWFSILPRDADRRAGAYATLESSIPAAYYFRLNWEN